MGVASVGSGEYHAVSSILSQMLVMYNGNLPTTEEAKDIIKVAFDVVSTCVTSVSSKHNILTYN